MIKSCVTDYIDDLQQLLQRFDWQQLHAVTDVIFKAWRNQQRIFICGNGGSAANANHIANDFSYGINPDGRALNIESLAANNSIMTCLGNDLGYENIFSRQLQNKASKGDVLIVLSGSGNSENIIRAMLHAKASDMTRIAILGYSGGEAKGLANHALHFDIDDMQIAEDMQLIVGHMLMKDLKQKICAFRESHPCN